MAIHKENLAPIVKASTTSITLASTYNGQTCTALIGGRFYRLSSQLTLSTATSGALGGLDTGSIAANTLYYVYLCVNSSGVLGLVMSTSSSAPSGSFFSAYKYIGKTKTFSGSTSLVDVNPLFVGDRFDEKGIQVSATTTITNVFTMSGSNPTKGTVSADKFSYHRNGDWMHVTFEYAQTGAGGVNGTGSLRLGLDGLTINSARIVGISGYTHVGSGYMYQGVANTEWPIEFSGSGGVSYVNLFYRNDADSTALLSNTQINFAATINFSGEFRVPITEYSGLFT